MNNFVQHDIWVKLAERFQALDLRSDNWKIAWVQTPHLSKKGWHRVNNSIDSWCPSPAFSTPPKNFSFTNGLTPQLQDGNKGIYILLTSMSLRMLVLLWPRLCSSYSTQRTCSPRKPTTSFWPRRRKIVGYLVHPLHWPSTWDHRGWRELEPQQRSEIDCGMAILRNGDVLKIAPPPFRLTFLISPL